MNMVRRIVLLGMFLSTIPFARTPDIDSFFDRANQCDYLIVTPRIFSEGALLLAQYRNGFGGDDVVAAGYVVFEKLIAECPHPERSQDTLLREAIAWAVHNWKIPPSYIVLLGDDSAIFVPADSSCRSRGPLPSYLGCFYTSPLSIEFQYSDDWYLPMVIGVSCSSYVATSNPPLAIGRIPCEHLSDLNRYIEKVQRYEAQSPAPWRNRVLLAADDRFIGDGSLDDVQHASNVYTTTAELSDRFVSSVYFNDYTSMGPPEVQIPQAREAFFNLVNSGMGWTVVYAHGYPEGLTHENTITAGDVSKFRNQDKPTLFFSLACSNGAFYAPMQHSMCKQFLFATEGGAVAFIGNPNATFANIGTSMMEYILQCNRSFPALSIGMLIARWKQGRCFWFDESFEVFGDPALRTGAWVEPLRLQVRDDELVAGSSSSKLNSGLVYWQITSGRSWYDTVFNSYPPLQRRDSIMASGTADLAGGAVRISLPSFPESNLMTFAAYAWNDSAESRGGFNLYNMAPRSLPPTMLCTFIPEFSSYCLGKVVASGDSMYVGVVDENKVVQWTRRPSGALAVTDSFNVYGNSVVSLSKDGNVFIADYASSRGGPTYSGVKKIDWSGSILWSFWESEFSQINGIMGMRDSGAVVWYALRNAGGTGLIRLNADGKLLWKTMVKSEIREVTEASSGECRFTGSIGVPDDIIPNRKALVAGSFNLAGEALNEKIFLKGADASGSALAIMPDGRYIIAGTVISGKGKSLWLLCLDGRDDTLWSRTTENVTASTCLITNDNEIGVGGSLLGTDTSAVVVIYDQHGNGRFTLPVPGSSVRLLSVEAGPGYQFRIARSVKYGEFVYRGDAEYVGILSGNGTGIAPSLPAKAAEKSVQFSAATLPSRRIMFTLGTSLKSVRSIDLFDLHGRRRGVIDVPPGCESFVWNSDRYVPGIYLIKVRSTGAISALVCRL